MVYSFGFYTSVKLDYEYSGLIPFRIGFDLLAVQILSPDGEAEPPILRPPNAKRRFIGKDLDAGKN